jgi:hypothetical protein
VPGSCWAPDFSLSTACARVACHIAPILRGPCCANGAGAEAAAAELDDVARGLPDAEVAALAAQHAELGARAAALGAQVASAAAVADLQARLDDFDAQVAAGGDPRIWTWSGLVWL